MSKLGIAQITQSVPHEGVEFRVDVGTYSNGDTYKGYEYAPNPGFRLLQTDLDAHDWTDEDRKTNWTVAKRLKGNWYIYLVQAAAQ